MEKITLDTAVGVHAGATDFEVASLLLDWKGAKIDCYVIDSTANKSIRILYEGATATSLMTALNTADLPSKSLHKRILERAQTDGFLGTGTISGAPD